MLVTLALFALAAWASRRRDGRLGAVGGLAWGAGGIVAATGVSLLADVALFWLAPLPTSAEMGARLLVAGLVGGAAIALSFLPARAVLLAPVAAFVLILASVGRDALLADEVARAWSLTYPGAFALLAVTVPRAVTLAAAGGKPRVPAGLAAGILVLAVFPALISGLLGIVWAPQHSSGRQWNLDVEPTTEAPFVLTVPFLASDVPMTARLLDGLRDEVRVVEGDAVVETLPSGDGFVVRGRGPVRLAASYRFLAVNDAPERFGDANVRLADVEWAFEGDGGARVAWTYGRGCGAPLRGEVTLGDAPAAPTGPTAPTVPPSPPQWPPCVHGD